MQVGGEIAMVSARRAKFFACQPGGDLAENEIEYQAARQNTEQQRDR